MNRIPAFVRRFQYRRGAASALIILLLVLLVFFGVLALVASAADLRLSRKQAEWNRQYYLADARAEALLADLDQYCRTLPAADLEAGRLAGLLEARLGADPLVISGQVGRSGDQLLLDALVAENSESGQGIRLVLQVRPGGSASDGDRLTVIGWTQWQPPFNYDEGPGGVWEG